MLPDGKTEATDELGTGGWIVLVIMMVLMVLAVLSVGGAIAHALAGRPGSDNALEELRGRYARGEIDADGLDERRRRLADGER